MPRLIPKPAVRSVHKPIALPTVVRIPNRIKTTPNIKPLMPTREVKERSVKRDKVVSQNIIAQSSRSRQYTKIRKSVNKHPNIVYSAREITQQDVAKISSIRNSKNSRFLVIIGNGPSILETNLQALQAHDKIDMMSINRVDQRVWPTDLWLFCDKSVYQVVQPDWERYNGQIFHLSGVAPTKPNTVQFRNIGGIGYSLDMSKGINVGRSSVYAAMQIGHWLGYEKIFIFGCDMSSVDINGSKMMHFYGVNARVTFANRAARFDNEATYYDWASKHLDESTKKKYYFCSSHNKYDFVDNFNRMDHKTCVGDILDMANLL